jgi:hypothetical protein
MYIRRRVEKLEESARQRFEPLIVRRKSYSGGSIVAAGVAGQRLERLTGETEDQLIKRAARAAIGALVVVREIREGDALIASAGEQHGL